MPTFALTSAEVSAGAAPFRLADFLRVLDERRGLIRNVAVGFSLLTLLVLFYLPTLYSSSTVVMLDQRKNNVADLSSVLSALPTDPSSVQNQIQVLSSRDLAGRVIGKLKLYNDPEFNPALNQNGAPDIGDFVRLLNPANWSPPRQAGDADYERDAIVGAFLNRLDVSALGLSTSITVTFSSRDPAKAALIANTLADAYTEDQVDIKVAHTCAGVIDMKLESGAAGNVQHHARQRFVERHVGVAIATNAFLVAQRLRKRLTQGNTGVFGAMVIIDMQVTITADVEINQAMPDDLVQHVVKKRHAAVERALAAAVKIDGNGDSGFIGITDHGGLACGHVALVPCCWKGADYSGNRPATASVAGLLCDTACYGNVPYLFQAACPESSCPLLLKLLLPP